MIDYETLVYKYGIDNPWSQWLMKKQRPASDYSIAEYKQHFKRKMPFWATTFSDRGIHREQIESSRYKMSFLVPDKSRSSDFWCIERELLIDDKKVGRNVVVERISGSNGALSRISLIHLNEIRGLLLVHEENKVKKGVWERTTREVDDRKFVGKTWPTFRDLPDMWSKYF